MTIPKYFTLKIIHKFEQNFNGTEIILQDIKKITLLDRSTIINVLREFLFDKELINDELVEKIL